MSSKRFSSRLLAIFLAVVMIVAAFPVVANAAPVTEITLINGNGISWADKDGDSFNTKYNTTNDEGFVYSGFDVKSIDDDKVILIPDNQAQSFTGKVSVTVSVLVDESHKDDILKLESNAEGYTPRGAVNELWYGTGTMYTVTLSGWAAITEENLQITASVVGQTFNVNFPSQNNNYKITKTESEGQVITGAQEVNKRDTYKFTVTATDKTRTPDVYVNGEQQSWLEDSTPDNGIYNYQIENVTENKTVTVNLLSAYNITIPACSDAYDSYSVEPVGRTPVRRDGQLTFTVTPQEGWKVSVYFDGKVQTPSGKSAKTETGKGEYTITAHSDNPEVRITPSPITYSLKVEEPDASERHYTSTLSNLPKTVPYQNINGNTISFTLSPEPGYDAPTITYKVGADGQPKSPLKTDNTYTIPNTDVTDEITINVGKPNQQTRSITFARVAGVTYEAKGEMAPIGSNNVATPPYGTEYKFKVNLDEAYDQSKYTVTADGATLTVGDDGYYTVTATKDNTAISVEGVALNTYKVTLDKEQEGYTVNYGRTVNHGADYSFTITTATGYDTPTVQYMVAQHPTGADGEPSYGSDWKDASNLGNGMYSVPAAEIVGPVKINVTGGKTQLNISKPTDVEQHHNEYSINFDDGDGKVNYGETLGFTVAPTAAYNVERVTLVNPVDQRVLRVLTPDRTDRDGSKHYTVESISTNAQINVEADATVLTVTITDSLDEGNRGTYQMVFSADPADLAVQRRDGVGNVDTDNGHLIGFPELGGKAEKYDGAYECSWTYANGLPFDPKTFTMPHEDTSIEITAKYEVNWSKAYTFEISAKWENPNDGTVFVLTITTSNMPKEFVDEAKNATVLGFGIFSSTTQSLNNDDTLKNFLREKGEDFNWRRETLGEGGAIVARNAMIMGTRFDASNGFSYMIGGYSQQEAEAGIHLRGWIVLRYNGTVQIVLNDGDVFSQNTPAADTPEEGPSMEEHNGDLEIYDGPVTDISEGVGLEFGPNEPEVPSEPLPADPEPVEPAPVVENDVAA